MLRFQFEMSRIRTIIVEKSQFWPFFKIMPDLEKLILAHSKVPGDALEAFPKLPRWPQAAFEKSRNFMKISIFGVMPRTYAYMEILSGNAIDTTDAFLDSFCPKEGQKIGPE